MIWSLIGSIGGKVLDTVDNVVEDKDEANRLKVPLKMEPVDEPMTIVQIYGNAACVVS